MFRRKTMQSSEILSIGSLVIDYINGTKRIGGASVNVAVNTHLLGAKTQVLTALSQETDSQEFSQKLDEMGITVHGLTKTLEKLPRCIFHMSPDGKEESYEWFGNGVEEAFQEADVDEGLIQSTPIVYLAICENLFASKVARAVSNNQTLSYNPGSRVFEGVDHFKTVQQRADYIFLNEREYGHLVTEGIVQVPKDLILRPNQVAVITAGKRETLLVTAQQTQTFFTETVNAIDETGAGDSFASAFLWGRTQGFTFETCIKLGNLLASFVVQQVGGQINQDTKEKFVSESKKRNLI